MRFAVRRARVSVLSLLGLAAVAYVPFMPLVFRYSRVFWIYFERWANPNF